MALYSCKHEESEGRVEDEPEAAWPWKLAAGARQAWGSSLPYTTSQARWFYCRGASGIYTGQTSMKHL